MFLCFRVSLHQSEETTVRNLEFWLVQKIIIGACIIKQLIFIHFC